MKDQKAVWDALAKHGFEVKNGKVRGVTPRVVGTNLVLNSSRGKATLPLSSDKLVMLAADFIRTHGYRAQ